ncbi:MAG TPA: cyclase family protein [Cyclobacteriaceae bacterium]|nr:cyclase family protein [Cyclobacteriaceae bacterium]
MKKLSILFGTIISVVLLSLFMQSFKAEPKNMNRLIDLSHVIEDGMITYKGLPAPIICDYLSREESKKRYDPGTEFQIGKIEMVSNTGTYIDCPFHRYADGQDLSEVGVERFAELEGIVIQVDLKNGSGIGKEVFEGLKLKDKAVLVNTSWSKHWRTDAYFENHPFLTEETAIYLRDEGVKLVGIDSHNIDDTKIKSRPVHTTLLKAGVLIVEHLCNLDQIPKGKFVFNAVPPKFKGVGTFPVRAYARML